MQAPGTRRKFAREELENHFGLDRLPLATSSKRQFGIHLLPDLQQALSKALEPYDSILLGLHQSLAMIPLNFSSLLATTQSVVETSPVEYQDIDIGEEDPFHAIRAGMWLIRVQEQPVAVVLSRLREGTLTVAQVEIIILQRALRSRVTCCQSWPRPVLNRRSIAVNSLIRS